MYSKDYVFLTLNLPAVTFQSLFCSTDLREKTGLIAGVIIIGFVVIMLTVALVYLVLKRYATESSMHVYSMHGKPWNLHSMFFS